MAAKKIKSLIVEMKSTETSLVHQYDVEGVVIGRSREADFVVNSDEVSRKHLRVYVEDSLIFLFDLGSKNGTFVNGKKIKPGTPYEYIEGNPITLGKSKALFKITTIREEAQQVSSYTESLEEPSQSFSIRSISQNINIDQTIDDKLESSYAEEEVHLEKTEIVPELPIDNLEASPFRNDENSEGDAYDIDESLDGRSGNPDSPITNLINEIEDNGDEELEVNPLTPDVPEASSERSREPVGRAQPQIPSEAPETRRQVSKSIETPNENPYLQKRIGRIEYTKKNKAGFYKSPAELVVEIGREVGKAIDKRYFNIPDDKKAKKKAEKILNEVFHLAADLKEKAYKKHDRILDKAVYKAKALIEEAETDREKIISSGRSKISALEKRKLEDIELESSRILEDVKVRAEKVEAEASAKLATASSVTGDIIAKAKTEAADIINKAEGKAASLSHKLESMHKNLENEMTAAKEKKQLLEDEKLQIEQDIKKLNEDKQNSADNARKVASEFDLQQVRLENEKARVDAAIDLEHQRLENEKRELEDFAKNLDSEKAKFEQRLNEEHVKFEAEQSLLAKKLQDERQIYEEEKSQIQDLLIQSQQHQKDEISVLESELHKERKFFSEKVRHAQNEFEKVSAELEGRLKKREAEFEATIQKMEHLHDQGRERKKAEIADLDAEIHKYQKSLTVVVEDIESRKRENQGLISKLERAEEDFKRFEVESSNLKSTSARMKTEISLLKAQRLKIETQIEEFEDIKKKDLENLSELKAETFRNIQKEKDEASQFANSTILSAEKRAEEIKEMAIESQRKIVADANLQSERILKSSEEKYGEIIKSGELEKAKARDFAQALTEQVESWRQEQEKEVNYKVENIDNEINSRLQKSKKNLELELADLRVKRETELEESLRSKRNDFEDALQERAEDICRVIDQRSIPFIKQYLQKDLSSKDVDKVSLELQKAIMKTIKPDKQYADEDLKKVIGIQAAQLAQSQSFWTKTAAIAGVVLAVLGTPFAWKEFKIQTRELASIQKETASDIYVKKIEEKRKNKPKFEPEMQNNFLVSYTDRVLYTQDYISNELEKDYRERWILELNEFFTSSLRLSDNVIVTFIAKESNLIKELEGMRQIINPQFVDESTDKMRVVEKRFTDEVKRVLKTKSNYKKFQKFKKNFYEKTYL